MKIAVFPGSFDPITKGHEDILLRALPLFDRIIVAIGENQEKNQLFDLEKRKELISATFKDEPKIMVKTYNILTVDFCKQEKSNFLLRGIRDTQDFDYERNIAVINKKLSPNLETIFLMSSPEFSSVSSSIVKDIYKKGHPISAFVPDKIAPLF